MREAILGVSAFYHDSAAALVVDGQIVAAAHEERFTRKKHDSSFPSNASAYAPSVSINVSDRAITIIAMVNKKSGFFFISHLPIFF